MVVGKQALDGYLAETGARTLDAGPVKYGPGELTASFLRTAAAEAADLLGDSYTKLRAADRRGQSSRTPPAKRHRLVELVSYAEDAADSMERASNRPIDLDGDRLSELITTTALFQRWRHHPAWPKLVATLSTATEGQHTVMLLASASYLADAGNGVGIVFEHGDGRNADIWIEPMLGERLDLEVKTPQALRGPRPTRLTTSEAETIIGRHLKKAASTGHGQLSGDHSGILAIGGFHLGEGALARMEKAAARILARQARRKQHLAALVLVELSYKVTLVVDPTSTERVEFSPAFEFRVVRHPGYTGGLEIREGQPPWQSGPPSGPATSEARSSTGAASKAYSRIGRQQEGRDPTRIARRKDRRRARRKNRPR